MTVIDRINELRLRPGDTIRMRSTFPNGFWSEYQLGLLWHGEQIAVWHSSTRTSHMPDTWSEPHETSAPDLAYGDWRRVQQGEEEG